MESLTDASTPAEIHAALPTHAQLLLAAKTLLRVANVVAAIYRWRSRRKYPKGDVGVERAWREHRALYLGGGDAAAQQAAEDEEAVSGDEADEKEEPQPPAPARSATQPLAAAPSVSAAPPSRAALAGRGALADEQSQLDAAADGGQAAESAPAAAAAPAVSEHKAVGAPPAKRQKRKTEMERLAAVVLNTPRRG
jgi:hypothetical protein